jgi:signal transduction histidine kinase
LDIEFLKKEIEMLLGGIEEGSRRTAEIVKGLRIFSRMDRDTLVSANINECINSTLVVMKSLTKGEVTIVKEYADNLPALDCFPGKLNQVFMNILTNAVQATKLDGRQAPDRKIDIKTSCDENNIIVTITDNGMGMDEAVKAKIFDPFFTTKSVGEGTGLGLSIAMGIVSEHNGKIEVNSHVGKGTQFLITLPRLQSVTSKAA